MSRLNVNFTASLNNVWAHSKKNPEGFTVELTADGFIKPISRTSGFVVAYRETQNCFDLNGLQSVIRHAGNPNKGNKLVGGWYNHENGRYYFDSVMIIKDLDTAIRVAKDHEQLAIFDLWSQNVISI